MRRRRSTACVVAATPLMAMGAGGNVVAAATAPIDPANINHAYTFAASQLTYTAGRYSATQFPATTSFDTGQWATRSASDWRAGFFPGQLWHTYARTGDTVWRDRAASWTSTLLTNAITHDHDIGFVTLSSWGHALHLGATPNYRAAARSNILANAQILADRFKPAMGLIDSWDNLEEPDGVCIDNMMNLELLFTATALGGSRSFHEVALAHAQTTRQAFLRADGGSYHVVRHEGDGGIERKNTMQGYGDETTWSRGQAWAIHGFATTYRFTRDDLALDAATRAADYFIANLPNNLDPSTHPQNAIAGDFVPPSDFDAERGEPEGPWNDADNDGTPNEINSGTRPGAPHASYVNDRLLALNSYTLRDSSAAAVAASGLFDLARALPADTSENHALRDRYFAVGRDILNSLLTHDDANVQLNYLADGVTVNGSPLRSILARGSERWTLGNNGLSYGDYYFLEALARYGEVGLDFLPAAVGNQWSGAGGAWGDAAKWTAGTVPAGVGQAAHFRHLAAGDTTVTLDAPRTVGIVTFSNAAKYTIAGGTALRLERGGGAEAQVRVDASPAGGHEIATPVLLAGDVSVSVARGAALTISGAIAVTPADVPRNLHKLDDGALRISGAQLWPIGSTLRVFAGELALTSDAGGASVQTLRLSIDGGRATLAGPQHLLGLSVNGSAHAVADRGRASPLAARELAVAPGATLDLNDNRLVTASPIGTAGGGTYSGVTGLIQRGHHGGAWDGDGITTSMPAAATGLTSLGISLAAADVIVLYTYAGDANLDGFISGDDYSAIDFNILMAGSSGWFNGDFNYDGAITGDDYSIIDFNIMEQGAPFSAAGPALVGAVAVPEPDGVAVCLIGALAARRRRRRAGHATGRCCTS